MLMFDLIIHSGTIVADYGVFLGSIAVSNGKVVQILGPGESLPKAKLMIDATGKTVFPGFIDSHVHIWEPGQTHRDDFEYGTRAAAMGGITTILEHPLSVPPVRDKETFTLKLDLAKAKSYVDFGLWGALTATNLEHVKELNDLGCVAFKGFISYANEDYPHLTDSALVRSMEIVKTFDGIAAYHAENADLAEAGAAEMKKNGRKDPLAHLEGRESFVELEAIKRAIFFAELTGVHLHIVHMSIHEGAQVIKEAKARGINVTVETCPHYLAADCTLLQNKGPFGKCTPPLRRPENTEKLWSYVLDGTIDFIASDHSSYTKEEKNLGLEDIWKAEPGLPGIGTMVPIMADVFINERHLPLTKFAQLLSTNVAKIFKIYPQKGTIQIGSDADFTILDLNKSYVVDGSKLYKCGWSPYDGKTVGVSVEATILRGTPIYQNGEILVDKGFGRFIAPNK